MNELRIVFIYFETLPLMCYFQFIDKHVFMQNLALIILIYNPNNLLYVNLITKILVNKTDNLQWDLLLQTGAPSKKKFLLLFLPPWKQPFGTIVLGFLARTSEI